ncbi:MFS transporter [Nakamurella deserti]|uniref:MFS transporter n=1 Tax=Nakamurella deserti TaxID=2164074 RepID=UPI000DBE4E35|nr:MFS transporter [Nakamurella deserti]
MEVETTRRAGAREWAALAVLTLAVVLLAVDGTVLSLAVPALTRALDPSATELLWIGDSYSFALAGLLVTMGTLADRIGRKKLLLIGTAGFGLASMLAAFAPGAGWLVAARVLLGVAGATLMPSTLSIIRNVFTDARQRTTAIAVWSAGASGGAALGPLVGGALLEHFWWGSVFLINVPVMAVLLVTGLVLIPESRDPRPGRFDPLSSLLSLATVVPVVFAVKHLVSDGADLVALGSAVVGVLAGRSFVRRQRRLPVPLFDVGLFRVPAFAGAVAANLLAIFAFSGLLFFFSQYLQLVRGYGPLGAGLRELPITLATFVSIALVGVLVTRLGRGRAIGAGMALAAVGLAALAVAEASPHYGWLALSLLPVGLGIGVAMTLTVDAVVSAVPPAKAGAASAVSETAYELGVALGIAVLGSLITVFYRSGLVVPDGLGPEVTAAARESLASASAVLTGDGFAAAAHAFTGAMQWTSGIAAVLLLLAAVVAWRIIPSTRDVRVVDARR